jgi:hypothetical protein
LTAKADFAPGVNQNRVGAETIRSRLGASAASQTIANQAVAGQLAASSTGGEVALHGGAGGRASQNRVNHAQIIVTQQDTTEMQRDWVEFGVNLEPSSRIARFNFPCNIAKLSTLQRK